MKQKNKKVKISYLEPDDSRQKEITLKLIDLDHHCFGKISDDDEGNLSYWLHMRDARICFVAFAGEEVVGYLDCLSLKPRGVELLSEGKLHDGKMGAYVTGKKRSGSHINLYVLSLVVNPEFRGQGIGKALWDYARKYFAKKKYKINEVLATLWTDHGKHFFKQFETRHLSDDCFGHPVVELEF